MAANTGTSDDYYNDGLSTIERYQNNLRAEGYSDDVVNGVAQGLNSGNQEIADWITQYNQGAEGQANPINIPQTEEEIAAAREGKFNTQPLTGNASENQGLIDNLLSKFAGGLGQIAMGYQENNTQGFSPSNLTNDKFTQTTTDADGSKTTKTYDKTALGRLGEAAGTIGRLVQNPTVQGLAAGGLGAALTGNPLYGVGLGYKMANQRAMSDLYQNALAKNGVETNPGTWGNLTSTDMNTLMTPTYKKQENELKEIYYDNLADYHNRMTEEKERHNKAIEENQEKNAEANMIRAQNSGKSGSTKQQTAEQKAQSNPDWNQDLADYIERLNDPRYAKQIANLKAAFIKKYGVDPNKYIKF